MLPSHHLCTEEKKKKERRTLYTTTAPLEIISLFYRMGREFNEEKKSPLTLQLPDDTPIPDPVYRYKLSRMGPTDSYCDSPRSLWSPPNKNSSNKCHTVETSPVHNLSPPDLEVMDSSSWFDDDDGDELIVDGSPSVLFHNSQLSSNEFPEDSSISSHKKSLNSDKKSLNSGSRRSIEQKNSRIGECRSTSSDCVYSDGNDALKINIAEFKSPEEGECLSGEEKGDGELPFLKLTKDKLSTGLLSTASSKTHLNSRFKTYERHNGKLSRISWKKNSFATGALIRAATSETGKLSPKDVVEEKQQHWSVKVLPLSFFTSSESIGQVEAKRVNERIHSTSSEK